MNGNRESDEKGGENMLQVHIGFLRQARRNSKMTLLQAAQALGINKSTLSKYERGKSKVKSDTLLKMAEIYNVSIEQLLKEE